jgi:hypothetical protein
MGLQAPHNANGPAAQTSAGPLALSDLKATNDLQLRCVVSG